MPRPRTKPVGNTVVIFARLSKEQHARLEQMAERMNMTRAGLTKYLMLKALEDLERQMQE